MEENQVVQKVTKPKNQGRVEAGKKLAEWNRAQKARLKQVTSQELAQEPVQVAQELDSSTSPSTSEVVKSSHVLVILAAIGALGVAYIFRRKRSEPAEKAESMDVKAVFDPFKN